MRRRKLALEVGLVVGRRRRLSHPVDLHRRLERQRPLQNLQQQLALLQVVLGGQDDAGSGDVGVKELHREHLDAVIPPRLLSQRLAAQ